MRHLAGVVIFLEFTAQFTHKLISIDVLRICICLSIYCVCEHPPSKQLGA